MKTLSTLIIILLFGGQFSQSLASNYDSAMLACIKQIYSSRTQEEYQASINMFERIALKEQDHWEPHYYAAFGYIMLAIQASEPDQKDGYLDQADNKITDAMELSPDNVELLALKGFADMIRITVDPPSRGAKYSMQSMASLQKALQIDPDNPRALYLCGEMEFGTARFLGLDTTGACAKLAAAIERFDQESPENPLAPKWGKDNALRTRKNCQ